MLAKLFFISSFLLISCAHNNPQTASVTPRKISSEQNLNSLRDRPSEQVPPELLPTSPEASAPKNNNPAHRQLNIPPNQTEIADKCEKQFADLPTAYNSSVSNLPINHRAIKLSYNMKHRIPNWVFYTLNRQNLMNSCGKRKDKFQKDPVLVASPIPRELIIDERGYKNSGFDRGHMAPSGDFVWNQEINEQTFYMTNMSPQTAGLNQKTWNKLEERIRAWACGFGELKVYTGPIIEPNLKRLDSCVSIPNKFFKVLLGSRNKKMVGIAFVYDQNDSVGDPYQQKAISIRKLEEISGLNFFADDFAQKAQDEFETQFDLKDWEGMEENCYGCDGVLKKGQ